MNQEQIHALALLKSCKIDMEIDILKAIHTFETQTGMTVEDVNLVHQTSGFNGVTITALVTTQVVLK